MKGEQVIAVNAGPPLVDDFDGDYRLVGPNLDSAVAWFLDSLKLLTEEAVRDRLRGLQLSRGETITIGVTLEI